MPIGNYLKAVAAGYSTTSMHSEGHSLLRLAPQVFGPHIPAGLRVEASGGKGTATFTPWIGILDPDEAPSPQNGIYLVYIFQRNLKEVILTLNQGVTDLSRSLGFKESRPVLSGSAEKIRAGMRSDLSGLNSKVDYGPDRRQAGYAAGNILAKSYNLDALPPEEVLLSDLRRLLRLYQEATAVKRKLLVSRPGAVGTASPLARMEPGEDVDGFKPKDRRDYLVKIEGGLQKRTADRHELLLAEFGALAKTLGHHPRNVGVHPRDLTLDVAGESWLVEAKVVYGGNGAQAVRAAIGQLMEYSYVLYEEAKRPKLLALFTEPVGDLYVELLQNLGIATIWKGVIGWQGSDMARRAGLVKD